MSFYCRSNISICDFDTCEHIDYQLWMERDKSYTEPVNCICSNKLPKYDSIILSK